MDKPLTRARFERTFGAINGVATVNSLALIDKIAVQALLDHDAGLRAQLADMTAQRNRAVAQNYSFEALSQILADQFTGEWVQRQKCYDNIHRCPACKTTFLATRKDQEFCTSTCRSRMGMRRRRARLAAAREVASGTRQGTAIRDFRSVIALRQHEDGEGE